MTKLLECVPNFSEGRNRPVIDEVARAVSRVKGVTLMHVDSSEAANRTVMTFAGQPEQVAKAAYAATETAARLIDMRQHKGTHPRMGATDVCPLIPMQGMTMQEADETARNLARDVGSKLDIPVYLYERSASRPERANLADIRKGGFEGLAKKMLLKDWQPDFGPAQPHPRAGATVIGARDFLVAWNINLSTRDVQAARNIAEKVRTSGRTKMLNGKRVRTPGRLRHVKAIGWYIPEFGCTQVSMNLTNFRETSMAEVYETVTWLARREGTEVNGSELVGMLPLDALLNSAHYYGVDTSGSAGAAVIHMMTEKLGLDAVKPFKPEEKIIEYRLTGRMEK